MISLLRLDGIWFCWRWKIKKAWWNRYKPQDEEQLQRMMNTIGCIPRYNGFPRVSNDIGEWEGVRGGVQWKANSIGVVGGGYCCTDKAY